MKDETQELKRAISIVMKDAHFSERDRQKVMLQIKEKRKKTYPKWIIASVASIMIIGIAFTFGGSHLAGAAETFINKLFGSKENLMQAYPEESEVEISYFERHLEFAEENLTEEEFTNYTQLIKEETEIWSKVREENREPDVEEAARLHQIGDLQRSYTSKFAQKEAQHYASYTISKPAYIPEGYKQVGESFSMSNEGEEPVAWLDYSKGEFGFQTYQQKINQKNDVDYLFHSEKTESYSLNGFEFVYVNSEEANKTGLRVTVPDGGYKITMIADTDTLSKEEMENVLLSMIEK
jgi:hypothetical protein